MSPALSAPAELLSAALERDDLAEAGKLVSEHLWLLVQSDWELLTRALDRLPAELLVGNPALALVKEFGGSVFLRSGVMNRDVAPVVHGDDADAGVMPDQVFDAILLQEMLAHRLRGDLLAASAVGRRLRARASRADAHGRRPIHAMAAFYLLHVGITESLAGDLEQALRDFAEARVLRHPAGDPLTDRDVELKSALVGAALGRLTEAGRLLGDGGAGPGLSDPFASQLEGTADAARALVAVERLDEEAGELVRVALDSNAETEMWPFALLAATRWSIATGDLVGAIEAVDEAASLRPVPSGSLLEEIVATTRARALVMLGEFGAAARCLEDAGEGGLRDAEVVRAGLALYTDGPEAALGAARELAVQAGLGPSARAEAMLIAAWAQTRLLGAPDAATAGPLGALIAREGLWRVLQLVPEEVADGIPGVEAAPVFRRRLLPRDPSSNARLTPNELEILRLLSGPESLPAIARARFVTLNTVKTQVASIYRRLGVHGRREAVAEAARRGILGRPQVEGGAPGTG